MGLLNIIIIAFGLSMDATAVSMAKGMCSRKENILKLSLTLAIAFGFFQGFMPFLGYLLGSGFTSLIQGIDHWIAFLLLGIIGIMMIREKPEEETECKIITFKDILLLGIATSIDALAIGITFAFLHVNILVACLSIGIITAAMSFIGTYIGFKVGNKFEKLAGTLGGSVLILIGLKILIEHLLG